MKKLLEKVPVLYKISTLVDSSVSAQSWSGSRSLQNFYSCRCLISLGMVPGSRSLQNFYSCRSHFFFRSEFVPVLYKISTLVDRRRRAAHELVPVLYKISTLVDSRSNFSARIVPVLYKISTLVDSGRKIRRKLGSRSLQNFYSCRYLAAKMIASVFPFFTKFLLL